MNPSVPCPLCGTPSDPAVLAEAHEYAFWRDSSGACPACVQQTLLCTLLVAGDTALHSSVQSVWPLDAEAAFGIIPTPLRLHADPRFVGRQVTIALVDSGFYPHPDLTQPRQRIRAWVDATGDPVKVVVLGPDDPVDWPGARAGAESQWHGTMTSVVAAGNGFMSRGLYRGLAHEAELVLIQVRGENGRITDANLTRALTWVYDHATDFGIRVVSLSVGGDGFTGPGGSPVDDAVMALVSSGVSVVAAAGNDGVRRLIPPATAPLAITVGGIDDHNVFSHTEVTLWHSNYGEGEGGNPKPELVAPSLWVAAPVLPETPLAQQAQALFARRRAGDASADEAIAECKLITPHYMHVDGTSFAAPVVASAIACMLEANPALESLAVRDALVATAHPVQGAPPERQGAGALDAGRAVLFALAEHHRHELSWPFSPVLAGEEMSFRLHDHSAGTVAVFGTWDGWRNPWPAALVEPGFWETSVRAFTAGTYQYKFLLDGTRWLNDPGNPHKSSDGLGGLNTVVRVGS